MYKGSRIRYGNWKHASWFECKRHGIEHDIYCWVSPLFMSHPFLQVNVVHWPVGFLISFICWKKWEIENGNGKSLVEVLQKDCHKMNKMKANLFFWRHTLARLPPILSLSCNVLYNNSGSTLNNVQVLGLDIDFENCYTLVVPSIGVQNNAGQTFLGVILIWLGKICTKITVGHNPRAPHKWEIFVAVTFVCICICICNNSWLSRWRSTIVTA